MVRVAGLEPAASCSQSTRATSCATHGKTKWKREPESNRRGLAYETSSAASSLPAKICDILLTRQAHYRLSYIGQSWRTRKELNPQPLDLEASALPVELHVQTWCPRGDSNSQNPASKAGMSPNSITRASISVVSSRDHGQAMHALSLHRAINPGTSHQAAHCACVGGCAKAHPKYGGAPRTATPPFLSKPQAFGVAWLLAAQLLKNLSTSAITEWRAFQTHKKKRPGSISESGPLGKSDERSAYTLLPPGCLVFSYPLAGHKRLTDCGAHRFDDEKDGPMEQAQARTNGRCWRLVMVGWAAITMDPLLGASWIRAYRPAVNPLWVCTVNSLYCAVNTQHNHFFVVVFCLCPTSPPTDARTFWHCTAASWSTRLLQACQRRDWTSFSPRNWRSLRACGRRSKAPDQSAMHWPGRLSGTANWTRDGLTWSTSQTLPMRPKNASCSKPVRHGAGPTPRGKGDCRGSSSGWTIHPGGRSHAVMLDRLRSFDLK